MTSLPETAPSARTEVYDRPVMVVGSPRSGTTWVQRILLSHPKVCGGQESHFFLNFSPILRAFKRSTKSARGVGMAAYWEPDAFRQEVCRLWRLTMRPVVEAAPQAEVLLEKTPEHAMHMEHVCDLLPGARFIHVIRDSRAVVASMLAASKDEWGDWAPSDVATAIGMWYRNVEAARKFGATLGPDRCAEVFYEDLKSDGAPEVARLFRFIGVEVSREQVEQIVREQDFEKQKVAGGSPLAAGAAKVRAEPKGFFRKGSADAWKKELTLFQQLHVWRRTRHLMRQCGYDYHGRRTKSPRSSPPSSPSVGAVAST